VRAGSEQYGFPLASVEEVIDLGTPAVVPGVLPAFRGVVRWRARHCSVMHLGALIEGGAAPEACGPSALVVRMGGLPVALEVDEVVDVVEAGGSSVGASPTAGASGVWVVGGRLVTMLDVAALAGRMTEQGEVG